MKTLRKLLHCDTIEDCRRIQAGHLILRRLSKWSALFTVAFALLINDAIGLCIDRVFSQYEQASGQYKQALGAVEQMREQYTKATGSVFYRWTLGWFYPPFEVPPNAGLPPEAPKLDESILSLYRLLNSVQFVLFLGGCAYCLRWLYADFRANGRSHRFARFCLGALVINLVLYFGFRVVLSRCLNEAPNHALQHPRPHVTAPA